MGFSEKFIRKQFARFGDVAKNASLDLTRRGQTGIGALVSSSYRKRVRFEESRVDSMCCSLVTPRQTKREGVVLYVHGGGYCSGDLAYAKCFASMLADKLGVRVFTHEYRLAPESKFPAALDDTVAAYLRLSELGYRASDIVLCGESAGGGLCYALCLRLLELGHELPAGIVAISPWTDLTASGESYEKNSEKDISMTLRQLDGMASIYTDDRKNPLVSPLFGDLRGMPPSLIFAGGDEIMLDDARLMHEKLLVSGCESELHVAEGMWHAYLLLDVNERQGDFAVIDGFLASLLKPARERIWLKLDNSAKIYPASRSRNWACLFRLSATMKEEVDKDILKTALAVTVRRFPSVAVRLSYGAFWYYLQELSEPPEISDEFGHPIELMKYSDIRKCAFRVLVYGNRIAVEFFHALTDGTGGLVFLKSLLAEYAERRYGESIPCECGILDRREEPREGELSDDFLKYAGNVPMSRRESNAFHVKGEREPDGFMHATTFTADADELHTLAKSFGVSVTALICAVEMKALMDMQNERVASQRRRKPIKVLLPVNLRNIFPSVTVRNFALYITPEITPALGDYTFEEICKSVHHQMGAELTANRMRARITTNVNDEKSLIIKIMPLFIKNAVMKGVFNAVGDRKNSLNLSNLGVVKLPEELSRHVERMDFILNVPSSAPNNSSVITFGGRTYISFVRNIRESELELRFHEILRDMGVRLKVESNSR